MATVPPAANAAQTFRCRADYAEKSRAGWLAHVCPRGSVEANVPGETSRRDDAASTRVPRAGARCGPRFGPARGSMRAMGFSARLRARRPRNCAWTRRSLLPTGAPLRGLLRWALALLVALGFWLPAVPAQGLQLTGVLLESVDDHGNSAGPVWHTASGFGARPLGFTRWPPPQTRGIPFPLAPDGSLSIELWPAPFVAAHVTHLFWQYLPGEFPTALVLNLYFNGDNVSPGISAWVPWRYGFTNLLPNPAPTTRSLYLDPVDNPSTLAFDDGKMTARLTAAFFFPSHGEPRQWRPRDFTDLDRVGTDALRPDGQPDGVLIFELKVEASSFPSRPRWRPPWRGPGQVPQPLAPVLPEEVAANPSPGAVPAAAARAQPEALPPSSPVPALTPATESRLEEPGPSADNAAEPTPVENENATPLPSPERTPSPGRTPSLDRTASPQASPAQAASPSPVRTAIVPTPTRPRPHGTPTLPSPRADRGPAWWKLALDFLAGGSAQHRGDVRARAVAPVLEAEHDANPRR